MDGLLGYLASPIFSWILAWFLTATLAAWGIKTVQARRRRQRFRGAACEGGEPAVVVGSLAADADTLGRRGWIVGAFFDEHDVRHCQDLEVKYGQFRRGEDPNHPAKVSSTTEFTLILSGAVRAQVGGREVILSQGDYVLIHPGIPNNVVLEVLQDTAVLTVKAPSDPGAKRVLACGQHHDDGEQR